MQYYILKHGPAHVFRICVVRFSRIICEEKIIILKCRGNNSVLKVKGGSDKFQVDEQAIEMMAEAKPNSKMPTTTQGFHQMISLFRYFWLGIHDLGRVSMLSVRTRQSTSNESLWRRIVWAMLR